MVDVRRSSDDTEASFTAAEVAGSTMVDWVGVGNDGHVTKLYDQSGNDNHAVQATPASQPKIVDGGALVAEGLKFDGVDDYLDFSGGRPITSINNTTSFIVAATTDIGTNQMGLDSFRRGERQGGMCHLGRELTRILAMVL